MIYTSNITYLHLKIIFFGRVDVSQMAYFFLVDGISVINNDRKIVVCISGLPNANLNI